MVSTFSTSTDLTARLRLTPQEHESLTIFFQHLVQTPSFSANEGTIAQLIIDELRAGGVQNVRIDRAGSVVATVGQGNPILLFDSHMDTVRPAASGWRFDPFSGTVEDGVLYGLGACDAKGSIAAMVYAARHLVSAAIPLRGQAVFTFMVQEERCEGCALKVLVEEEGLRPDWVVLAEASDLRIMRGQRGRVLFRATVRGSSSHASRPEMGDNAILDSARLIFGIDLLSTDLGEDPFLGPGTVAVTQIESQSPGLNTIPDRCSFTIDRRLTLGETPKRALAQIEQVIEREGIEVELDVNEYHDITYTGYPLATREAFSAWILDEHHPLIESMAAAYRAIARQPTTIGHWAASTDGVYSMGEANIPTIGFGPGKPEHAHTPLECVRLDDVVRAAEVYTALTAILLG